MPLPLWRASRKPSLLICLIIFAFAFAAATQCRSEPKAAAVSGFNAYVAALEARLQRQHQTPASFLAGPPANPQDSQRLRGGPPILEKLTPASSADLPGALLHHWRGTTFVPGATAAGFDRVLRDFNRYPQVFAPQVLRAKVLSQQGDRMTASMRIRQKHILTVVLDSTYDVTFGHPATDLGWSASRSTAIQEIDSPGTPSEHPLSPADEHGFLWRLNSYWSWQERDGGLYIQIESVSLTRSIPPGLGWAIGPFIESIPRESLEFTLHAASAAVRK